MQGFVENLIRKEDLYFFRHVRMTKETFKFVKRVVDEFWVENYPGGNLPITSSTALLIALWYLGNKSTYREIAEQFGVVESSVYDCVGKITDILFQTAGRFIKWPHGDAVYDVVEKFKRFADFPRVVGAVDGRHIDMKAPSEFQADYLDRTNRHSVNLKAICDSEKKFTYISAGFPGSAHDNRVFKSTPFFRLLEQKPEALFPNTNMHIIGDSAFQINNYILVPYKDLGNLTQQQQKYNTKLSKTRCIVENSFALLKGRFRRLKYIDASPERIKKIIITCCVLHNITLDFHQEEDFLRREGEIENVVEGASTTFSISQLVIPEVDLPFNLAGQEKRDFIAAML